LFACRYDVSPCRLDAEYMEQTKARQKPGGSSSAIPPRTIAHPVPPSTKLTPERDAPTDMLWVGDRTAPRVLDIPPITIIPATEGVVTKRKKKRKSDVPSLARSPKRSRHEEPFESLASSFLGEDLRLRRRYPITWARMSRIF